jgi:DNA-binding transcriptional MerR regulator
MKKEKIGTIARFTGLAPSAIKYYESMGLIDTVRDDKSNYRYYELNQRTIIHECMHYRKLEFPVKDIDFLISEAKESDVDACFDKHLQDLDEQISHLMDTYAKVQKTKYELEEWNIRENQWFVESVEPVLIYWQTQGVEWIEGREIDKAGIDFEKYDTRTFAHINKNNMSEYKWGIGIDVADYQENSYDESMVEKFESKRAYVAYIKVDEAIGSGKAMKLLDHIFIDGNVFKEYPGDIYFRRIKMVVEDKQATSYYKVIIPIS